MENKILVTGGNGLVGSEFIGNQYFKPTSKESNLIEMSETNLLMSKGFDSVIHCAAKVGGVGGNMNFKGEYFYNNIIMNTNIIESARLHNVKNLVVYLSTCVFPDDVTYPLTESKIHMGPPHISNDAYAYAKRMADIQIRSYKEQYGLNYKSVIPCNI